MAVVEISLLLTSDAEVQELNREYRGKDRPTNVLSFPDTALDEQGLAEASMMGEPLLLGDIVMARETLVREASEQNKEIQDHLTHLLVHGVLHLAGFDHMEENEAEKMENLEIMILQDLHISNPYLVSDQSRQETPDRK
jgi:probable rRNA maturation factor